ncbi:MFS general substrate transporter [Poronia punctata]|nr:MFS general substrate transporter [Poronia punctata]
MATRPASGEPYGNDENSGSSEHTPLLVVNRGGEILCHGPGPHHQETIAAIKAARSRYQLPLFVRALVPTPQSSASIISVLCIVIFVGSAAGGFQNMSMTRIFEDILCRRHYERIHSRDQPISEEMCKVDTIQSELAYLLAIMNSFNAGFSVIAALPWGIAADTIGRRPVFALSLTGMSLAILWIMVVGWFHQSIPPRLIWLSPVAYLLGGGNPALSAAVASMATDVVSESERSVSFMRIHGASMVGNLISPALASIMMSSTGPWPVLFVAFWLTWLPAFAIFLVPESLGTKSRGDELQPAHASFKARSLHTLDELKKSVTIFNSPPMIIILLITMLQLAVTLCTFQFLGQFTSKRYHIPLADTGFIQSAYGVAFITVSFFVLPLVSSYVVTLKAPSWFRFGDEKQRDLFFARFACAASIVGAFILGLAPSIPVFVLGLCVLAFGAAAESFLKGVATLFVSPERRSRLFTILSLAEIASDLWISPALAALFSLGMRLGGIWMGLPYFGVSIICVLMLALALFLRLPKDIGGDERSDSNEDYRSESADPTM